MSTLSNTAVSSDSSSDGTDVNYSDLLTKVGKNRDKVAFSKIFSYYAPRVKSFLLSNSIDENTAEELAQEAMVIVWRKAHQYDASKAQASTWIFTIARNKKIDLLRKKQRRNNISKDKLGALEDISDSQLDKIQDQDRESLVREAMKQLPDEQAKAIELSFVEGLSHSEISDRTGLPLGTVKSRIRLGLRRLQNEFNDKKKAHLI